ncbi:hypothetical protein AAG906_026183 [Vitis piasezkii]
MHPPCMSAPSCIMPSTEQLVIQPHIVPLLPTFNGMESENPYAHIKEFEELNSLRPRSIRTWTDLQVEFLKKFFLTHRTNGLKRQISNFSTKENEKFYECWERYMEAINVCPHHGFDTWLLPNAREVGRMKSQPNAPNAKAGMYTLNEDIDMKAKVAAMARRLEELEMRKIRACTPFLKTLVQAMSCSICQSFKHLVEECPAIPTMRETFRIKQMLLDNLSPLTMLHMATPTIQIGGTIQFLLEAKDTSMHATWPSTSASLES